MSLELLTGCREGNHRGLPLRGIAMSRASLAGCLLVGLLGLTGCDSQTAVPPQLSPAEPEVAQDPAVDSATLGVWLQGVGILDASLHEAQTLAQAIQALLDTPNDAALNGARLAWQRSHGAYLEFELFVALSKSNPGLFGSLVDHDFAIEAWPIQPGYLDYFDVYTHSGIVNDVAMPLTAEALRQQHGFTDSSDVSLGFHALEYLLWGENGKRPASDYVEAVLDDAQSGAGVRPVDLPNNRRRALIGLLADLLIDDINAFKQAVENPNGLLRRNYLALQPLSRLALLQHAGYALLSHHRDLLHAQLENRPANGQTPHDSLEAEGFSSEEFPSEGLQHSPFAGGTASDLAHSLATVEQLLVQTENGLGHWLIDNTDQQLAALRQLVQLRADLLDWHDRPWPPADEGATAMVETLAGLVALFEPQPLVTNY